MRIRHTTRPLDRFVHRFHLPDPEACHELLGLRERAVDERATGALEQHSLALGARVQPFSREHDPGLDQLLVEITHFTEELLAGHYPRFGILAGLDQNNHFHRRRPFSERTSLYASD